MLRILTTAVLFFILFTFSQALVQAAPITLPFDHNLEGVRHLPNIEVTEAEASAQGTTRGVVAFQKLMRTVGGFLSLILGPVALMALFLAGYQLVTAQTAASEEMQKQKMNVVYIVIGLILFWLSGDFVYQYLFRSEGEYLLDPDQAILVATDTVQQIKSLLNLFLAFSGAAAILMLVTAALRLIINPGTDDVIEQQKKLVGYTALGIIIIGLADNLVNRIIFPSGGYEPINVGNFEIELQGLSNYALGFLGVIIFVTLVLGGVMMVANFGNDDIVGKVKTSIKNVVIGAFVAFSAYTIVATLLRTFMAF